MVFTGGRDVTIRGRESGERFRSISQAVAALTGQAPPPPPRQPQWDSKKRSRAGESKRDGSHGIRVQTAIPECNQTAKALSAHVSPLLEGN